MNKKPRIAVIGLKGLPAYSGAGFVGEMILNELSEYYDFTVYSNSANTSLKSGIYRGYLQIVFKRVPHQGFNFILYFIKSAYHCMVSAKYDIIHVHHLAGALIVPILRLKYKNVIVTSHGMPDKIDKWPIISKIYYPLMRFLFARCSTIITTVSDLDSVYYVRYTHKKINYIPNGITLLPISKIHEKDKYDLFFGAGRIMATKGCHILLEALIKSDFKGKVVIAGDLNQIELYKKKLISLSKALNVCFLGLIKDKSLLLGHIQNSKLFIFPSSVEAMSMMLLEVALTKTPIIASDIPANLSVFNEDEVLFFKTDDIDDLANKIKYAFDHPEEMKLKADFAYNKLLMKYNINTIAKQYHGLYQELLS